MNDVISSRKGVLRKWAAVIKSHPFYSIGVVVVSSVGLLYATYDFMDRTYSIAQWLENHRSAIFDSVAYISNHRFFPLFVSIATLAIAVICGRRAIEQDNRRANAFEADRKADITAIGVKLADTLDGKLSEHERRFMAVTKYLVASEERTRLQKLLDKVDVTSSSLSYLLAAMINGPRYGENVDFMIQQSGYEQLNFELGTNGFQFQRAIIDQSAIETYQAPQMEEIANESHKKFYQRQQYILSEARKIAVDAIGQFESDMIQAKREAML